MHHGVNGIEHGAKSIENSEKKKKNRKNAQPVMRASSKITSGAKASPFRAIRTGLVTAAGPATMAVQTSPAITASASATTSADLERPDTSLLLELFVAFTSSLSRSFGAEGDLPTFSSSIP